MAGRKTQKPVQQAKSVPPARAAALDALRRCLPSESPEREHASAEARAAKARPMDAQAALDAALTRRNPLPRDAALATELFYGTLRRKTRLEHILAHHLERPEGLPPAVLSAMTLAAYEILHLERVPARASVNWGVDAANLASQGRLGSLANAVLRKVAKLAQHPLPKDFFGRPGRAETLAAEYACPLWIVRLWLEEYGTERTERYLAAQLDPPALGIAVRHDLPGAERLADALAAQPGFMARSGLGLAFTPGTRPHAPQPENVVRLSFAARQALDALDPHLWPDPIWDACAGRGGKTRLLLERGKQVVATDVHRGRIRALVRELPDVAAAVQSALGRPPQNARPRAILLDAPCSGLGTLARRPDIKWKRSEDDIDPLVELQANLLENAWKHLPKKGVLAYVTCTLNPDENERQIAAFLAGRPQAERITEWTTPHDAPFGEFFYAALIRK